MLHSKGVIAVPPGATIREQLEMRGMSQREFAQRMALSEKHISHLINGKVELTPDVALRLESVLGVHASFWTNLEALYREQVARVNAENELEEDIALTQKFPYAKMAKLGWVPATKDSKEKVESLRSFFEVARLNILNNLQVPGIAFRKAAGCPVENDYTLAAWAQKARFEARNISVAPINIEKLRAAIPEIRALTTEDPAVFCPELRRILSGCGIAIVFLPHIERSFLHGATFTDGDHIVLGLTVRGRDADRFWLSLFHELYHIIAGHIFLSNSYIDLSEQETQADHFARDTLISQDDYNYFVEYGSYNRESILKFANKIGIAPGIIVGRLQKENIIPYKWHNGLKVRYMISP